ncbi:uncharacterized protein LOC131624263 [Vicia villosa]|uniref:uncharacterized protein LOC131624263 n=1 Tax=Vicia villosa TaxID=3911 RepID=UPI00273CC549|nr:uncharacterized protein LOC131624263 [Vicia villosa]
MRRFLVPRTSIEKVNVKQPEAEVEETPHNVANDFNPNEIVRDSGCRKQIHEYAPDIQDQVRRAYILKGPTQPDLARFPRTQFGKSSRAFCKAWYKSYTWIEYSESKDATYCFYCFLFKPPGRAEHFGDEVFNKDGFKDWKHASKGFKDHIGSHDRKVVERFIALHHVKYTTSEALKDALYGILDRHTLSISRIRGQGYDGTSNMRGDFNGLQRKFLDENPYAFYVHCYAHRLQLVVVSIASSCSSIHDFFEYISLIVTAISASCKRNDALKEAQHREILYRLESGEISQGKSLHQSSSLARPGDTRWVDDVKARLATLRESGWDDLFIDVQEFCFAQSILVPNMDEEIPVRGRSRREGRTVSNLHHYRAEIFYVAIDKICVEMDHRLCEGSNVVLDCFSCLDPKNSFSKFDVDKLARLANIYQVDFSDDDRGTIREQLETYVEYNYVAWSSALCFGFLLVHL